MVIITNFAEISTFNQHIQSMDMRYDLCLRYYIDYKSMNRTKTSLLINNFKSQKEHS